MEPRPEPLPEPDQVQLNQEQPLPEPDQPNQEQHDQVQHTRNHPYRRQGGKCVDEVAVGEVAVAVVVVAVEETRRWSALSRMHPEKSLSQRMEE